MRVTHVSLAPTQAAQNAGRPALTPELLAATGARYSRSNDGLEAILKKIDPCNVEKSVNGIFKMVDYGHASIADMAPVALFMDGVSFWLAYYIWSLCPLAGGQESSTRYLRLDASNLPDAATLGIAESERTAWKISMDAAFDAYEDALKFWERDAQLHPEKTRIPAALLADTGEKAQKQVARMKRNYAFDRARYFLPTALQTNVMMVQSARAWVTLCQQLLSHPLSEARALGQGVRAELELVAPRLLRHAISRETWQKGTARIVEGWVDWACKIGESSRFALQEAPSQPLLEVFAPDHPDVEAAFARDLEFHDNRYGFFGEALMNTPVTFGWEAIALGDIRDLNRHRTGSKRCVLVPRGFYGAGDQSPELPSALAQFGCAQSALALRILAEKRDPAAIYWTLLGTQFEFFHTTTADKLLYEAELRTGVGAHYRYARHLHDILSLWYEKYPLTRGLVLEGSAEPE